MEIINSLSTEVEDALTQHVETLEKLAQRLVEKRELSKQEIVAIIEEDKIK